jgi:hypothetical protein
MESLQPKQNGIICFYTDYDRKKALFYTDIYEIIDGKKNLLSKFHPKINELKIEKAPGIYDFDLDFMMRIRGLVVKVNSITYIGIHGISLGSVLAEKLCVSFGSTQLPILPRSPEDIQILASALTDNDWTTRRFAILALAGFKEGISEHTIEQIKILASSDRYEAVRKEAVRFLKGRKIPIPLEPFHVSTFTELDMGWNWSGQESRDPYYSVNGDGYHISGSKYGHTLVLLENLLVNHGFFGFNPKSLKNYDLVLDCIFIDGQNDAGYGLIFGKGVADKSPTGGEFYSAHTENYYLFCISKNGGAAVCKVKNNQYEKNPIDWVQVASESIVSNLSNRIKVEVRSGQFTYYVNDVCIGSYTGDHEITADGIGMVITNKMHVCFTKLAISKLD